MAAEKNPFLDPNYGLEPEQKAAANPFLDPNYGKETDGPLARGFNKAGQSMKMTAQLAGGDTEGVAQTVKDAADYAQANPSRPEGQKLMEAWDKGDGVLGGIGNVARQVKSDYDEAKGFIPGMKAVGRDLRAMGERIVEQAPNMIAPTVGMVGGAAAGSPAGGPAGAVAGGWVGASAGNALVEGGDQIQTAIQKAGIDPRDTAAVRAYLDANGDQLLKQTAIKGGVIGAVDTATAGLAHFLLTGPGKAAAGRALSEMGVDVADKAAVKTATQSDEFAKIIANDAAYQASKQGVGNVARNATAAGLEPAGEFAGEYLGQGLASGDWDTKNAALEALSSVGQSGAMFAGQKAWQYATSPAQAKAEPGQAPGSGPNQAPTASPATPPPADPADTQDAPLLALPAPTYTGTPNDQMLQAEAERANAVAEAEARAAGIYQQRADFEAAKQGQPEQPPVNAGLELVRQAYAAQLDALQQQEQDQAAVPQSSPPDGRAALEAQAAQAQAQREADRAVMGPDDEILQSTGAVEPPHRAMGIDPAAGPLSAGAAIAVDTGVAGQMQAAAQAVTAQDAAPQAAGQDPAAAWNSMSTPERAAVAGRVGLPPVIANNIPRTGWEGLNSDLQARISKAMAPADGASPSTPAQGSQNGRTADPQDNARLAAQGGAQWRADVDGGTGDLVQPADGAAGTRVGAASAGPVRGGAPVESAGTTGGGRGAVGQAAPFRPKNLVQLVREAGGVSIDRKADINQDSRTVGVFRKGGMDLDGLAELLQQNGFMTDADVTDTTSGAERAAELLRAALAGERVLSMNDVDEAMGRDAEAQYREEIRRKAAEYGIRTTFRPFGDVERDVLARDGELAPEDRSEFEYGGDVAYTLEPLDDIDLQDARTISEEDQMRMAGFSEDEINETINGTGFRESQGAPEQAQSGTAQESRDAGPEENPGQKGSSEGLSDSRGERVTAEVAGTLGRGDILRDESGAEYYVWSARFGHAGSIEVVPYKDGKPVVYSGSSVKFSLTDAAREANPERRSDPLFLVKRAAIEPALTSYTNEDIARQEAAQRAAAADAERNQREADQKAQADAERDTFALTGSDRAADVLAAQGHGGLFDAPAASAPDPKPQAAPVKADPGARWDSLTSDQRAEILTQPSGWSTSAGGLNVIGKQLAGKGWAQIPEGTRGTIARLMEKAVDQVPVKNETRANAGPAPADRASDQEPIKNPAPAVGNAPSPLEALFSDLNSDSTRKANKAKKAAAKLPEAARIEYVQANFHDILMQMMEAGALEVNGFATLTEDNAPCL